MNAKDVFFHWRLNDLIEMKEYCLSEACQNVHRAICMNFYQHLTCLFYNKIRFISHIVVEKMMR